MFFRPQGDTRWNQSRLAEAINGFEHYELDILNRQGVLEPLKQVKSDAIVHTAAKFGHDRPAAIPFDDFDTNAVDTLNLREANRLGVKTAGLVCAMRSIARLVPYSPGIFQVENCSMANVLATVSLLVGSILAVAAAATCCLVLFPMATGRSRVRLETQFHRCLLLGMVILFVCLCVFSGFLLCRPYLIKLLSDGLSPISRSLGVNRVANDAMILAHVIGWGVICPFLSLALLGYAAITKIFVAKLEKGQQYRGTLSTILCGSALPIMGCCIPIIGWFFFAPILILAALGSGAGGMLATNSSESGAKIA